MVNYTMSDIKEHQWYTYIPNKNEGDIFKTGIFQIHFPFSQRSPVVQWQIQTCRLHCDLPLV